MYRLELELLDLARILKNSFKTQILKLKINGVQFLQTSDRIPINKRIRFSDRGRERKREKAKGSTSSHVDLVGPASNLATCNPENYNIQ